MDTVRAYGDRTALRYKEYGLWHDISWDEYFAGARRVACALASLGFKKGDRVAIIGDNCKEWVMTDMAVMCAGGVSVGVYATNSWDQCEFVISHSEAAFYFVENEEQLDKWLAFRDRATSLKKVIVWDLKGLREFQDPLVMSFHDLMELGAREDAADPDAMKRMMSAVTPEDPALFIYTSGTTGRPKAAVLTHTNITWIAGSVMKANVLYDTDEVLSYLPLCHVFERIFSVFAHVRYGYTVSFIENVDTITDNMREISPTVGYAVPRIWEKYHSSVVIGMSDATWFKRTLFNWAMAVARKRLSAVMNDRRIQLYLSLSYRMFHVIMFRKLKERLGFDRMRMAYSGAAPISPDVLMFFNAIGIPLLEGYGQTEATGVTTVGELGKAKIGTVGRPLDGVTVSIAEGGEVLVKSPGVFKGYFKDPDLTAESLREGWLHTGDIGEFDADGDLRITGRIKDIIITAGGKNITPQYIEGKLIFSPYINDAIVIGDRRQYLTCLIVLDEENAVKYAQDNKIQFSTYTDLARHPHIIQLIQKHVDSVNETLARVEQIKKFAVLPHKLYQEEGDVTPTMKVKRKMIMEKYKDIINGMY